MWHRIGTCRVGALPRRLRRGYYRVVFFRRLHLRLWIDLVVGSTCLPSCESSQQADFIDLVCVFDLAGARLDNNGVMGQMVGMVLYIEYYLTWNVTSHPPSNVTRSHVRSVFNSRKALSISEISNCVIAPCSATRHMRSKEAASSHSYVKLRGRASSSLITTNPTSPARHLYSFDHKHTSRAYSTHHNVGQEHLYPPVL